MNFTVGVGMPFIDVKSFEGCCPVLGVCVVIFHILVYVLCFRKTHVLTGWSGITHDAVD